MDRLIYMIRRYNNTASRPASSPTFSYPLPSLSSSPRSTSRSSLYRHVHHVVGGWLDVFAIDPSFSNNQLLAMRMNPQEREAIECLTKSFVVSRETLVSSDVESTVELPPSMGPGRYSRVGTPTNPSRDVGIRRESRPLLARASGDGPPTVPG
jgi:hypothetical protein